ncbi:MAG: hypothetical protein E7563_06965 [Ruminococcaceae bacterium]|nr:hypothetical protein [Oscillospiraceae bacterium]
MKKILALLIALLLVFSFAACKPQTGNTDTTTEAHNHTHTQEETTTANTDATQGNTNIPDTKPQTNDAPDKTDAPSAEVTTAPATQTEYHLYRGVIKGNVYTSSFTGIKFTKPDNWKYLSDEELSLKIGVDTMEMADNIFPTTADRVPAVYDMWATDEKSGINLSVAYENMHVTAAGAMTTDEYMEMLEGAFQNTKGTTLLSKSTVDLSGKMYQKAVFKTETGGTKTQSVYYLRAMGKFMNIILVTAPADTKLPDINKMFG